ncbi:hypothetical protein ACHAXM_010914 [Skeletonema potamos]
MSGRWRSRHWRPEDNHMQQHHRGGGRGEDQRNDSSRRRYYGGQSSWNFEEYDHRHSDRQYSDMSYPQQQQYPQQHEPRYNNHRRPQQQQQFHGDIMSSQWQRGQRLPQSHHDHPQQQQHGIRSGHDGRPSNSNNPSESHARNNSDSSNRAKLMAPSTPSNAWGRKQPPSSSAAAKPDVSPPPFLADASAIKVENQSSANENVTTSLKEGSRSTTNNNAWKKPNPPYSASSALNINVKSDFPSLTTSAMELSQHETKPRSGNADVKVKVEIEQQEDNIATSSSLPASSSWGKSTSSSCWATKQQPSSEVKVLQKNQGGEEFPSLSASLGAPPPPPPRKQQPHQGTTSSAAPSSSIEEKTKKGGSKNKSAPTNLASYLLPQLEGVTDKTKGNNTNNKKQQPSVTKNNKTGQKTPNVFHSASTSTNHISNKKKHPREEDRHAPLLLHHPSITTVTNSAGTTTTGAPPIKKGRQRLAPRKKKLTTLKKRVLEERLRVWKERNVEESVNPVGVDDEEKDVNTSSKSQQERETDGSVEKKHEMSTTLLVENFVNPKEDDLTDDDEHDELVSNLINLAGRVGRVVSVYIPRPSSSANDKEKEDGDDESTSSSIDEESNYVVGLSFVRLATNQDAHAARDILDGMVVGGQKLCTKILYSLDLQLCDCDFVHDNNLPSAAVPSEENERQWRRALLNAIIAANQSSSLLKDNSLLHMDRDGNVGLQPSPESTIVFHNILSSDDYEDEDALEESIEDIKSIAGQYGHVVNARGDDMGNVYVSYDTCDVAAFAAQKLDGMVLGGVNISVCVGSSNTTNRTLQTGSSTVVLDNVLSEDDFEDEDCLNESIADIRTLTEKYGVVGRVIVDNPSSKEEKGRVHVEYTGGMAVAEEAAKQLNGMMFGGRFISATLLSSGTSGYNINTNVAANPMKDDSIVEQEPLQPMFSGDKIIPERFAQCKRVPKVANSGTPRSYATKIADIGAVPLLTEMLGELMRLQERSKDQKNARSRRRLVMGLREVARGIRAHKVKMVIMANNLDEYGAIDSKLQEILDLAHAEDVPVIFELNKRKLGKAVGKSIKVSVVGIQNFSGAEQQFKQLKRMAGVA